MKANHNDKKIFALNNYFSYAENSSAKSDVEITNSPFDKRHLSYFVYGGLLGAAHVAGRFFCRGVCNLRQSATNIRLQTDGGSNKPKTKDQVMNASSRLFILPLRKRRYFPNNHLLMVVVNYSLGFFVGFSKTESFIDKFCVINSFFIGENNVASQTR